ncbi:hypothetical protein ACUXAV_006521 [Cupriavidus metallidurans]|uniref:hypothetical protein n=1 Tax=Cupriavidus TaxID=106589 RepID=UPI001266F368|nr:MULTISPECIES: hypothetical protein [Cupriavidus]MDE4920288.1 hypothetical protein [Cupriavidus metallidurans]
MTKNPDAREATLVESLRMIAPHSSRVHIGRSIPESLGMELKTGRSIAGNMLLRDARHVTRRMLAAIAAGSAREDLLLRRIVEDKDEHQVDIAKDFYVHAENKDRVAGLIEELKEQSLTAADVKALRAGRMDRDARLELIHTVIPNRLGITLAEREGYSPGAVWSLLRQKPMVLRHQYYMMWLCMDWIRNGGYENVDPQKISNDLIDRDYILTASSFHGLVSGEGRVNEAYQDIMSQLAKPPRRLGLTAFALE